MPEYQQALEGNEEFLSNHAQLLQSLLLSRQNAANQSYSENTEGIGNGSIESGEGISEPSSGGTA